MEEITMVLKAMEEEEITCKSMTGITILSKKDRIMVF